VNENTLLYLAFTSQILLISVILPRVLLSRVRNVMETHPPSQYPKLYPVSSDVLEARLRTYRVLNLVAVPVGIALLLSRVSSANGEILNWDDQAALGVFAILQFVPMILAERFEAKYRGLMKASNSRSTRTAVLQPRRLFDFVSPTLFAFALLTYFAFIGLVAYISRSPFPGFAGSWNAIWLTVVNLFFVWRIHRSMYSKRTDPYQSDEDRMRQIRRSVTVMFWVSIMMTAFIALGFVLAATELRSFTAVATSLYLQLCALVGYFTLRYDDVDYEVYRADLPAT